MNRQPEREVRQRGTWRQAAPAQSSDLAESLARGCEELSLDLGLGERECLLAYLDLLQRWNRVYNLTAIRDPGQMLPQHLLDSLAVMRPLQAASRRAGRADDPPPSLLDVGSGAGLPGLALALAWPALRADLVEPVGKKAAFLRQSVAELGLSRRVTVHEARVQDVRLSRPPDLTICRAFASLDDYARLIAPLLAPDTAVFAMKGQAREIQAEVALLDPGWRVASVTAITVPGLNAARHLVELSPPASAPSIAAPACAVDPARGSLAQSPE